MKTKLKSLLLLSVTLVLISCSDSNLKHPNDGSVDELDVYNSELYDSESEKYMDDVKEITAELGRNDLSIIDELMKVSSYEAYEITKLKDDVYLVGLKDQIGRKLNYIYSVVNVETLEIKPLNQMEQLVDNVYISNNNVFFEGNGSNTVNTFRNVPKLAFYDFETGLDGFVLMNKQLGQDTEEFNVGGSHNATLIKEILVETSKISYGFGEHITSVLAGGYFAPDISFISNEEHILKIDFENIFYDPDLLEGLMDSYLVEHVDSYNYIHVNGTTHTVMVLTFNDQFKYYDCYFVEGQNDYTNFIIEIY